MSITINGVTFHGNNIEIKNGVVKVDGRKLSVEDTEVTGKDRILKVEVIGNLASLTSDRSVTVSGDVEGKVNASGSVSCGDVAGSVEAGGSVTAGTVGKNVDAGGSVSCGSVEGNVSAGGSLSIKKAKKSTFDTDAFHIAKGHLIGYLPNEAFTPLGTQTQREMIFERFVRDYLENVK